MIVTRRQFAWLLAVAGIGTACKKEESAAPETAATAPPMAAQSEPVTAPKRVADVHVHMFNANFLPLAGVLGKWIADPVAKILAAILMKKVDDCGSNLSSLSSVPEANGELDRLEGMSDDQLIEHLYNTTPPEVLEDEEVARALSSVSPEGQGSLSTPPATRKAVAKEEFVKVMNDSADKRPKDLFPERGGWLQWITLMTWCEHRIFAAGRAAYPNVNLFVTHMMDMENYYKPSKPVYEYPDDQMIRMLNLTKNSGGRLLPFVAFDPKRSDWESIMRDAIDAGCAGVKFYPPNGYPPFDTKTGKVPEPTASFFRMCIERRIPLFTHCTPHGFESISGYGKKYANPELWQKVLAYKDASGQQPFRELRLCLGHAGGDEGWFDEDAAPARDTTPFSQTVVTLCKTYPNVYCELAYLSPILTTEGQRRFQSSLRRALKQPGDYAFESKVMYGSDWHMIHKIGKHREYLKSFINALGSSEWDAIRDEFFFNNAVRWLNLKEYVARADASDPAGLSGSGKAYLRQIAQSVT